MAQSALRILIVEDGPERQAILKNLFREHVWIMANTAKRANRLISVYDFDIVSLDYDLDGKERGDVVAEFIKRSRNANVKVLVHSMNVQGVAHIQKHLPNSIAIPISKITRDNQTFKRFRDSINKNLDIDWASVFKRGE